MSARFTATIALLCAGAGLLAACSGGTVGGTPAPATESARTSSTGAASSGASVAAVPKVRTPLPSTTLDGSPCDSALTTQQVVTFIGTPKTPDRDDNFKVGPACTWSSIDGVHGQINVYYMTKLHNGLTYDYQTNQPDAARWEATELQGYPAVAFSLKGFDQNVTGTCSVSVGVRDDLAFGVGLTLSDNARKRGVDSCEGAKDIANTVLTNLKGRP